MFAWIPPLRGTNTANRSAVRQPSSRLRPRWRKTPAGLPRGPCACDRQLGPPAGPSNTNSYKPVPQFVRCAFSERDAVGLSTRGRPRPLTAAMQSEPGGGVPRSVDNRLGSVSFPPCRGKYYPTPTNSRFDFDCTPTWSFSLSFKGSDKGHEEVTGLRRSSETARWSERRCVTTASRQCPSADTPGCHPVRGPGPDGPRLASRASV